MDISLASLLAIIGVGLVVLEVAVFGFGTVFLLFVAIGCLLSALLIVVGLLHNSFLSAAISVAIIAFLSALVLWKPLKKLQNKQQDPEKQPNAFKGLKLNLVAPLAPHGSFFYRYSGVEWLIQKADEDQQTWPAGAEVEVIKASVGKMWVRLTR